MSYTIRIPHDKLIDLLQDNYDNEIYENIEDDDKIEDIQIGYSDVFITFG